LGGGGAALKDSEGKFIQIWIGKSEENIPVAKAKRRWDVNIKMDIK
jgi:hypothetical protein